MSTAIKLLNFFIKKTKEICQEFSTLDDFRYDHTITAAMDYSTIGIYKINELKEIYGFFTATAFLESDLITFIIDYGGVEYSLHAYIKIKGKNYSYSAYQESVLGQTSVIHRNIRSESQIDLHGDIFLAFIKESYPIFKKNPRKHIRYMAKATKKKYKAEYEELKKLEAQSAIRQANMYFLEEKYDNAYKIYSKNKAFLSESELSNLTYCKKAK